MTEKKESKSIKVLDDCLQKELREVTTAKDDNGERKYSLTDRCKVYDRVLKLEAIKGKLQEGNWASGFADNDDEPTED